MAPVDPRGVSNTCEVKSSDKSQIEPHRIESRRLLEIPPTHLIQPLFDFSLEPMSLWMGQIQ